MTQSRKIHHTVEEARSRWLEASERASQLAADLFQPGSGYGDSGARAADEHRLQSAKHDAEQLFRQYHDLDRREMEVKLLDLQRSQRLATWASFYRGGSCWLGNHRQHHSRIVQVGAVPMYNPTRHMSETPPNNAINSDSEKRRSCVAPHFTAGYGERWASQGGT